MSKTKERSELEYYRGLVKELKSENKNLKKRLSRKEKREHLLEDVELQQAELHMEEEAEEAHQANKLECPKCSSELDIVDLGARQLVTCTSCEYRVSKKK